MGEPSGNNDRWLFRVASRPDQGGGHVRRCLVLSRALAPHAPSVIVLDKGAEDWLPTLQGVGQAAMIEGAELEEAWAGSVLDGYDFSERYARELSRRAAPLVVIDDLLAPPPGAHLVVNPAPGLTGCEIAGVAALVGPRYALVDAHLSEPPPPVRERVGHVLVSFGLGDRNNVSCLAIEALAILGAHGISPRVTVVLGATAPHLRTVREAIRRLGGRGELLVEVSDMIGLLRSVDLAIGAGGVSLLERMAAGVPSFSISVAENQDRAVRGASTLGATRNLGSLSTLAPNRLAEHIGKLSEDFAARSAMSGRARRMVDGKGAVRVAAALLRLGDSMHCDSASPGAQVIA
jgi:spore coat polysaccharide biosynthesis predicted glycosyltransferase SpsG